MGLFKYILHVIKLVVFFPGDFCKDILDRATESSRLKLAEDKSTAWVFDSPSSVAGEFVGAVERVLFFLALVAGQGIVIGFWLAFKVASRWAEWQHIVQLDKKVIELPMRRELGNYVFARFIIGTGLNLILAILLWGVYRLLTSLFT